MGFGKEESCKQGIFVPLVVFLIVALGGMYIISNMTKPQNLYFSQEPVKNVISVNGEAKTKVSPDELWASFTINTNDTYSAKAAQEKNARITENVKKALSAVGINEKDLETVQFSVKPVERSWWECPNPNDVNCDYYDRIYYDEVVGYAATHVIYMKSADTKNAGVFLDTITNAGGTEVKINYFSFTLKDETKKQLEKDLLEKAAQDAKNKAQKIASGAGVSVGKLTTISESVSYPYYYSDSYARAALTESAAPSTQVFGGQVDVTARVSASFEVG